MSNGVAVFPCPTVCSKCQDCTFLFGVAGHIIQLGHVPKEPPTEWVSQALVAFTAVTTATAIVELLSRVLRRLGVEGVHASGHHLYWRNENGQRMGWFIGEQSMVNARALLADLLLLQPQDTSFGWAQAMTLLGAMERKLQTVRRSIKVPS
jgi:hypothetical protein